MRKILELTLLTLLVAGISNQTKADDIYNFYFQKNPPADAAPVGQPLPMVTTSSTTPPTKIEEIKKEETNVPTQIAIAPTVSPTSEPEVRRWNLGLGLQKFGSASSISVNAGLDFSKYWGLLGQVYFSENQTVDANGNPVGSNGIGSHLDASLAVSFTPLHFPLVGSHSVRISILAGAITSDGIASSTTASIFGQMAKPMWGAMVAYDFSDRFSASLDTKNYDSLLPSLNYVSEEIGLNLTFKL